MALGPELITNGTFNTNLSGWTIPGGPVWDAGTVHLNDGTFIDQVVALDAGKTYRVQFVGYGSGDPDDAFGYICNLTTGHSSDPAYLGDVVASFSQDFLVTQADIDLDGGYITILAEGESNVDNVSVREVLGVLPTYNPSIISALTKVQQNSEFPQFVIGGQGTGGDYALFKKSSTYDFSVWRSPVYNIGRNFDVLEIKFAVIPAITTNITIIPVLYFDNEDSNSIGTTINLTNYPVDGAGNNQKLIKLTSKNFGTATNVTHGRHNFFLELQFTGTALAVVKLPITIDLEVEELN